MGYQTINKTTQEKFNQDGFVAIDQAVSDLAINELNRLCDEILSDPHRYTVFDWALTDESQKTGKPNIIQVSATKYFDTLLESAVYLWVKQTASALLGEPVDFWFDQFLIKPPENTAQTPWHQDEAYWGRALKNKAITCWIPLQSVDEQNGCMHFIPGQHQAPIIEHFQPKNIRSDLLACNVDEQLSQSCPLNLGGVTFHHCRTPHMTTANRSRAWRKALCIHLKSPEVAGEGELYPWRVYVDQRAAQPAKQQSADPDETSYF